MVSNRGLFLDEEDRVFQAPNSIDTSATESAEQPVVSENTPKSAWDVYNLLALDGGGVRGYWTLLVLERLMHFIAEREQAFIDQLDGQEPAYHSFDPQQYQTGCCHLPATAVERAPLNVGQQEKDYALRNLAPAKRYLPCHYFDYIGGSSTGALIAIMLGRLRMPVADCLEEYKRLGAEIFGKPRLLCQLNVPVGVTRTKYDSKKMSEVFTGVVNSRREDHGQGSIPSARFPSKTAVCRTFVTTFATGLDGAGITSEHILRSYPYKERQPSKSNHPRRPERRFTRIGQQQVQQEQRLPRAEKHRVRLINQGMADLTIPEVARAATAAPFYFDPLEVEMGKKDDKNRPVLFMDGGFGTSNNPTMLGVEEIQSIHGKSKSTVGTVVSVGTARGQEAEMKEQSVAEQVRRRLKKLINIATNPESEHKRMTLFASEQGVEYYRFNPQLDKHMLTIPLDQWLPRKKTRQGIFGLFGHGPHTQPGAMTMEYMDNQFARYVSDTLVNMEFERCASALVDCRRARVANSSKWERFAVGSEFSCHQDPPVNPECSNIFIYRADFAEHLRKAHGLSRHDIDSEAQEAMTLFRYQPGPGRNGTN